MNAFLLLALTVVGMRPLTLPAIMAVSGVSFHQDVVLGVQVGQPASITAEPTNEFDANACVITINGEKVGHVPKELAARLRLRPEMVWVGEVVEVLPGANATGLRVKVLSPVLSSSTPDVVPASPSPSPSSTKPVAPVFPIPAQRTVSARSGRRLGAFVGKVETRVLVLTDDKRIVQYPEDLVLISK